MAVKTDVELQDIAAFAGDTNEDQDKFHHVNMLSRLVPAGIHEISDEIDQNTVVKFTAALRPVRPTEKDFGHVRLEEWPSEVLRNLEKANASEDQPTLQICPIDISNTGGKCPTPSNQSANLHNISQIKLWVQRSDEAMQKANRLWQDVIPHRDPSMSADRTVYQKFDGFFAQLEKLSANREQNKVHCIGGKEADISSLLKIIRVKEAAIIANEETPGFGSKQILQYRIEAADSHIKQGKPIKIFYDKLNAEKYDKLPDAEKEKNKIKNQLDVTKLKRQLVKDLHFDEAARECGTNQKQGAVICGDDLAQACQAVEAPNDAECCADEQIRKSLVENYKTILDLRLKSLLATMMGDEEFSQLEKGDGYTVPKANKPKKDSLIDGLETGFTNSRLFALEELHDLGRYFSTYIDFYIPLSDLPDFGPTTKTKYYFVRIAPSALNPAIPREKQDEDLPASECVEYSRWSLVKVKRYDTNRIIFVPATREELILACAGRNDEHGSCLVQKDGVLLLGGKNAKGKPRYDLIATDLRSAAQDFENRADDLLSNVALDINTQRQESGEVPKIKSGGLSVVNFSVASRLSRTVGKANKNATLSCDDSYLDAEDLLIGRIPEIGYVNGKGNNTTVDSGNHNFSSIWRPTTARTTQYKDPSTGSEFILDKEIDACYRSGEREKFDFVVDRLAARTQKLAKVPEESAKSVAAVDEAEFTYLGDPMGVETGLRERSISSQQDFRKTFKLNPSQDLNITRIFSIPKGAENSKIAPRLRFGVPTRAAFRAVYLGGNSLKDQDAHYLYNSYACAAIPRLSKKNEQSLSGRRFLRSEPVNAPSILIPMDETKVEEVVYSQFNRPGLNRLPISFPVQSTADVILRTVVDKKGRLKRAPRNNQVSPQAIGGLEPEEVVRVILPPVIDLEMAEKHSAFDKYRPRFLQKGRKNGLKTNTETVFVPRWPKAYHEFARFKRPLDGLNNIHLDSPWGGPPVYNFLTDSAADRGGIKNVRVDDGGKKVLRGIGVAGSNWLEQAKEWAEDTANGHTTRALVSPPGGDGVFVKRSAKQSKVDRIQPFYPDPMAASLLIRLRRGATLPSDRSPNQDLSINVPFAEGVNYPDCKPIALSFKREFKENTVTSIRVARDRTIEGQSCTLVEVRIAPGEEYDLDMWCVPDNGMLAAWSEFNDTAATLGCFDKDLGDCIEDTDQDSCGFLCGSSPKTDTIIKTACLIRKHLLSRPLYEISAVKTIRCVHALRKPLYMPSIHRPIFGDDASSSLVPEDISAGQPGLITRRVDETVAIDEDDKAGTAPKGNEFIVHEPKELPDDWEGGGELVQIGKDRLYAIENGADVDLAGFLKVHLASTSAIEIYVETVKPLGDAMDDINRSRTPEQVQLGYYPTRVDVDTERDKVKKNAKEIYGFDVQKSGQVTLPRRTQLWARISNLPEHNNGSSNGYLSLHEIFARSDFKNVGIQAEIQPLFKDLKARKIKIFIRAISRHRPSFSSRPFVYADRYFPSDLPKEKEFSRKTELSEPFWIPASKRPASPSPAMEATPFFEEIRAKNKSEQRAGVRLWFQRPMFSSGENERIGLVIWPRLNGCPTDSRRLIRPSSVHDNEMLSDEDFMTLDNFKNKYLPNGSEYISRWASDPAERYPNPMSSKRDWLLPLDFFPDIEANFPNKKDARQTQLSGQLIKNVRMPIPKEEATEETEAVKGNGAEDNEEISASKVQAAEKNEINFLAVDLLAYEPRFDIGTEKWFIEIPLNAKDMVSPFVQLGVVTFQEVAPKNIQVSNPARPFVCQIPIQRKTQAKIHPTGKGAQVEVFVSGPQSSRHRPKNGNEADPTTDRDVVPYLLFRLEVRSIESDVLLHKQDQFIEFSQDLENLYPSAKFEIERELHSENVTVYVEERVYRPSASQSKLSSGTIDDFSEHVPRYMCKLDVKFD